MKYVIFDLDGCLADDRRRKPLFDPLRPESWDAYHADCENDPLINGHLISQTAEFEPIIFTSRPESVFAETYRWLRDVAKLNTKRIFMRSRGCLKGSPELKRGYLESLLKEGVAVSDIVCAYDDREDVLAMYGAYGIPAVKISYPPDKRSSKATDNLEAGAATFRQRNKKYGDSYLSFGAVMAILFPKGLNIKPGDVESFNRLGVYVQVISKACRYATTLTAGGHQDSAHDIMVYGAMLEEVTKDEK